MLHSVRLAFPEPPLFVGGIVLRHPEPSDIPWITAARSDREPPLREMGQGSRSGQH